MGHLGNRKAPKTHDSRLLVAEDARPIRECRFNGRFIDAGSTRERGVSDWFAIREQIPQGNRDPSFLLVDIDCSRCDCLRQAFNSVVATRI
jgi:hypothetical protein